MKLLNTLDGAGQISTDPSNRFVSDTEKATWNDKASTATVTTSVNGLMSSTDKSKLDGIANNANNYTLPVAAGAVLGGVKSGTDISVDANGNVSIVNDSHTHALGVSTTGNLETTRLSEPNYLKGSIPLTKKPIFDVLRADRTSFLPAAQIIIEQSTDAGETWTDAGVSDSQKRQLFTGQRPNIYIPLKDGIKSTDCMLRVTITAMKYNVPVETLETDKYSYWNPTYAQSGERYCTLDEGWAWINSNSDSMYLKVERATGIAPNTWLTVREAYMSGWSGGNYFTLDGANFGSISQTSNYWNWRFTFRTCTNANTFVDANLATTYTDNKQTIYHLKISGKNCWSYSNPYMYHDHLYTWNEDKNVTFPAQLTSTMFNGPLSGNASTATKLATSRTINGVAFNGTENITITADPNAHNQTVSTITDFDTEVSNNSTVTNLSGRVTTIEGKEDSWDAKSDFSGSYNDLTNKPTIPTALSQLTTDSTHTYVSDSEKATWNGKQDTISDLITIRSGASAGAVAEANAKAYADNTIMPLIVGTQGSSTPNWTGVAPFSTLTSGQQIAYKLPYSNSTSATLNLTLEGGATTGAINCYYSGASRITSHYPQGSIIRLTYFVDNLISSTNYTGWWADANYDSNNYDRTYWGNTITAGAAIYDYKLLMQGVDGKFYPLTLENGTGTTKTISTQEFVINSPILYYATTTDVSANATFSNVYSEYPITTLQYTANQAVWTSQLPIYLKGTILTNGNFKLDGTTATSFMTQTLPTTDDGFVYIWLGQMYSTTGLRLTQSHPMYEYKDGIVRPYIPTHTHVSVNITDFDTEVSNNTDVASNTSARHTHSNKSTLDAITASFTTAKDTKLTNTATKLASFTDGNILLASETGDIEDSGVSILDLNSNTIIDVVTLPTTNINEEAFYRVLVGKFYYRAANQNYPYLWTLFECNIVETLPSTGVPLCDSSLYFATTYYSISSGECYGYLDSSIVSFFYGKSIGWYPFSELIYTLNEDFFGGVVTSYADMTDPSFYLLISPVLYSYKNNTWISHKTIGWQGLVETAETFNMPNNIASGIYSHAEGEYTTASKEAAHSEGFETTASGTYSHSEGFKAVASNSSSHAEGYNTIASGSYSHAEGNSTTASGSASHAEGYSTTASGSGSHASGHYNTAGNLQMVTGRFATISSSAASSGDDTGYPNATNTIYGTLFKVGKGTATGTRLNAFRVTTNGDAAAGGKIYYATASTTGADYAENYEWLDGNLNNEDRRGLFVTLDGTKIRKATSGDDYILGIVSSVPAVVGDSPDNWNKMYLTDVFGNLLTQQVIVPEEEINGEIIPAHEETQHILNPDYDPELPYISRDFRKEWSPIGTHGKLVVIDDGTCQVNGYCWVSEGGKGTNDAIHKQYRVLERLDEIHIRIVMK